MHAHIRLRKYLISGGASKPYCSQYKWQFQAEWLNGFVSGWITGKIISPSRRRKSLKWRIYSWRLTVISVLAVYCRGIREWDICWVRLKMPLYLLQLLSFHRNSLGEIVEVRFQWLWHEPCSKEQWSSDTWRQSPQNNVASPAVGWGLCASFNWAHQLNWAGIRFMWEMCVYHEVCCK